MKKLLLICVAAFFVIGCKSSFNTAPMMNFVDQPVPRGMTMAKMEKCITKAGVELGWKMNKTKAGVFEATLYQREHTAVVTVTYSTSAYSIVYKSSSAGLYADENGKIHKRYNTWVNNLDRQINREITEELYK